MPSSGSSGNSVSRNSLLHCRQRASVMVGEVRMRMGGVRENRGSFGNGRVWEDGGSRDDCRD